MDQGTASSTPPPATATEDYETGRTYGLPTSTARSTTSGRFTDEAPDFAGRQASSRPTPEIIEHAAASGAPAPRAPGRPQLPALLALQEADHLPRHRAVVRRRRPRRPARPRRSRRSGGGAAGSRTGARRASTAMVVAPPRLVHPPPARLGRADPRPRLQRLRGPARSTARAGRPRGATSSREGGRRRLVLASRPRSSCRPGTACPSCGGGRLPQGDRHPRRLVRVGLAAIAAVLEGRLDLGFPAVPVPRRLRPAPRLVPVVAPDGGRHAPGRRPSRPCSPTASSSTAKGEKMSKSVGNTVTRREAATEVRRRRAAALGRRHGLPRRHPDLRASILNRLAEAYRKIRNTFRYLLGNLADFDPDRRPRPDTDLHELDRWALRAARPADRAASAGLRATTSSTPCTTRSTTSARSTSPRSTSTSSRTGSTPRRPRTGRRRAAQTVLLRGADRAPAAAGAHSHLHRRGGLGARARLGAARQRPPGDFPRSARSGSTRGSPRSGTGCSTCAPRSRGPSRSARQQGRIGKAVDAVVHIASAPEEQWMPLLIDKGAMLLATLFNVSAVRIRSMAPAGGPSSTRARTFPG